jgi:hypothetical protein
MLEGLDRIPWSQLGHAYGVAADVPEMLQALTSDDRDERENGLDGLFWSIHHQGTIYDSTAPAVPFLFELVSSPDVLDRDRILELLAAIAGGCGYLQVHQVYDSPSRRASPEHQNTLAEERAWQKAVQDAVWQGWPTILELLRADDDNIRLQALQVFHHLLAQPRPELTHLVESLLACLAEESFAAKAGILLRLGEAVRFHADPAAAFRAAPDHEGHEIHLANMGDLREEPQEDCLPVWLELSDESQDHGRVFLGAVWKSWPLLEYLAEDAVATVRQGADFLQAMLMRYAGQYAPESLVSQAKPALVSRWLRRLELTVQDEVQANLVFALAAIAAEDPRLLAAFRQLLLSRSGRLARYVAALKLVDLTGEAGDQALDVLLDVHQDSRDVYAQLKAMPRWEPYWVMPRLQRLGPACVERRLPVFLDMIRSTGKGLGSSGKARELLRLAFGGTKLPPTASVLDLTEAQRQLLLAAADNGHFWANVMNDRLELGRLLGLPDDRRGLRRFLARPGEAISQPRNDPEEAMVQFERLLANRLPHALGKHAYQRDEDDTRAPFRLIQEGFEEMNRISDSYRPKDRPRIRRLEPHGHACDALVALLPFCPNLEELDLSYGEATDASMHHLARLSHLKKLHLSANWITDAGLKHLAGLTGLEDLALWQTDITDAGLRHLANLVQLRHLNLQETQLAGGGLAHLRAATNLAVLRVGSHVTDAVVAPIAAFRRLKELHLGGEQFTAQGMEAWNGLVSLTELSLRGPLAPTALRGLTNLPALEKLNLSSKAVGTEQVRAIPALGSLKSLSLWQTAVTDAGLEGIERFTSLQRLDLSCTEVTDAVLPYLFALKSIRWIGFYRTQVSERAIEQLRRRFPEAHFGK